jgi:hypothetical protein
VPIVAVGGAAAGPDLGSDGRVLVLPSRVVEAARIVAYAVRRRR